MAIIPNPPVLVEENSYSSAHWHVQADEEGQQEFIRQPVGFYKPYSCSHEDEEAEYSSNSHN